ncbi:hypothetical protein CFOL_v3_34072 [Cephalotus follicularis]|uniref:DUF7588 domain-containing protein n=1 Tax=Cephalotus follicularis TaxID=3775 RepID=A0A1Q3DDQ2_CEPFO|nr:hypothetical protein CFOL_v3_34072 [Cephalotus follicularis]
MKPPSQLMAIIIDEPFEINKDLIRKDFLQEKYLRKRYIFFQKYSEIEQNNIRTAWYEYMIKIKAHVMFFDYLPIYKNQQENKKYFDKEEISKKKPISTEKIIKNDIPKIQDNEKQTIRMINTDKQKESSLLLLM